MPDSIAKPPVVQHIVGSITAELQRSAHASPSHVDSSEAWKSLIDDLLHIRSLKDDWDGQDAVAPAPALVDTALALALRFQRDGLSPADRVIAGPSGTVFFEWRSSRNYMEVEVASPGGAEVREILNGITTEYSIQ